MSQQTVSKLKELLFDRESRELDELQKRLDILGRALEARTAAERLERETLAALVSELTERAGTDAQLQRSVARVIDGAIRDAEPVRYDELTQALAPMVRTTFRAEIKSDETQADLTRSLYPKMGDMIRRYIASAMRDMMENINRRLEGGLTNNRLILKLRSIATGRSMAELALADTQRFKVEELYLIRRGSGELIKHWSRTPDTDVAGHGQGSNRDTVISAFLTAITSFAEDAFAADRSSLRSLDLDDHRIYLRASPAHLLAAKCSGTPEAAIEGVLDSELLTLLDAHLGTETAPGSNGGRPAPADIARAHEKILGEFSERIEQRIDTAEADIRKARGSLRPLKIMAIVFGLPFALFAAWQGYIAYQTNRVQTAVDGTIASLTELSGYPVTARVEAGGNAVWVSGLVPSARVRTELLGRIQAAAPGVAVAETIGVLPVTDVRTAVETSALQRAMDGAQRRLAKLTPDLERSAAKLEPGPQRAAVEGAATAVAAASVAAGATIASGEAGSLNVRLHAAIERLRAAMRQIAENIEGGTAAPATAAAPLPPTPAESADELAATAERLAAQVAALEHVRIVQPLVQRNAELEQRLAAVNRRIDALKSETPREALANFLKANAVFFSNGIEYRDVQLTHTALAGVVQFALKADLLVRVVGYTDEAGDPKRNQVLSQQRADKVAEELVARGLPRKRIVSVGRGTSMDVAPRTGATSANRRVEFEIGFPGEEGGSP